MKTYRYSVLFLILIFAFLIIPVAVQAQDDHGDTYTMATAVITDGTIYTGVLDNGEDVDLFRFSAISGLTYAIEITSIESGCATYITLETEGENVITTDDNSGAGLVSRIKWKADFSDTYYIKVEPFAESTIGAYEISVTESESPLSIISALGLCGDCSGLFNREPCADPYVCRCTWFFEGCRCCNEGDHGCPENCGGFDDGDDSG